VNTLGANQLAQSAAANAFNVGMANRASGLGGLFDLAGSLGSAYILS
jgi:ABC-type transporter lipoprotein component MlaA